MKSTKIEWADSTINFWWGCTKVSAGCANCYAATTAPRFSERIFGSKVEWGKGKPRGERLQAARKEALALNHASRNASDRALAAGEFPPAKPRVFVNSMSDWLDEEVPLEWLAFLLETISRCQHLDFLLLTKRPENWLKRLVGDGNEACSGALEFYGDLPRSGMPGTRGWEMSEWLADWTQNRPPHNVWIGTTVEDQTRADERIPQLLQIPARVRFLSCEPLLGPVDLAKSGALWSDMNNRVVCNSGIEKIHWVICGGESGSNARPMHPDWAGSLRDQCRAAGVSFFFKQWGSWFPGMTEDGFLPDPAHGGDEVAERLGDREFQVFEFPPDADGTYQEMAMVGKTIAGRIFDGVEHNALPEVRS